MQMKAQIFHGWKKLSTVALFMQTATWKVVEIFLFAHQHSSIMNLRTFSIFLFHLFMIKWQTCIEVYLLLLSENETRENVCNQIWFIVGINIFFLATHYHFPWRDFTIFFERLLYKDSYLRWPYQKWGPLMSCILQGNLIITIEKFI